MSFRKHAPPPTRFGPQAAQPVRVQTPALQMFRPGPPQIIQRWGPNKPSSVTEAATPQQIAAQQLYNQQQQALRQAQEQARHDQAVLAKIIRFAADLDNGSWDTTQARFNFYIDWKESKACLDRVRGLWNAMGVGYHSFDPTTASLPKQFHFLRPSLHRTTGNDNIHIYHY